MGRKILIVDDDRDTRELLRAALEEHGYTVSQAQSGLRLMSHLHDRPDLILLDVMMSWIDGFALCRAVKCNPEFQNIPVCFISGRSGPEDVLEGMACGAAAYFVKPLDTDEMLQKIDELTGSEQPGLPHS